VILHGYAYIYLQDALTIPVAVFCRYWKSGERVTPLAIGSIQGRVKTGQSQRPLPFCVEARNGSMDTLPRWLCMLVLNVIYIGLILAGINVFATLAPVLLNW
jgi:hypothetical protein